MDGQTYARTFETGFIRSTLSNSLPNNHPLVSSSATGLLRDKAFPPYTGSLMLYVIRTNKQIAKLDISWTLATVFYKQMSRPLINSPQFKYWYSYGPLSVHLLHGPAGCMKFTSRSMFLWDSLPATKYSNIHTDIQYKCKQLQLWNSDHLTGVSINTSQMVAISQLLQFDKQDYNSDLNQLYLCIMLMQRPTYILVYEIGTSTILCVHTYRHVPLTHSNR